MTVRRVIATVAAVVATAVPSMAPSAAQESPDSSIAEVEALRARLEAARGDTALLSGAVDGVRRELDAIEERLAAGAAQLARIRDDLAVAEERRDDAARSAATAATLLQEATDGLHDAEESLAVGTSRLEDRVRRMYMFGTDPGAMAVEGLLRSRTPHDLALTLHTVDTLMGDHQRDVADAVASARAAADGRSEVAAAAQAARRTEGEAVAFRDRVQGLLDEQARVQQAVDDERRTRSEALRLLERDRQAAQQLEVALREQLVGAQARLAEVLLARNPGAGFDGPTPAWARLLPPRGLQLAPAIVGAAAVAGVDARLLAALAWAESSFHPAAVSSAGAIGLAQLMPGTAVGLGVDPWDPVENLVGGARYLRVQLERFGAVELALAAYNAGPARVVAAGNAVPAIVETQVYVLRVLERFSQLVAASPGA